MAEGLRLLSGLEYGVPMRTLEPPKPKPQRQSGGGAELGGQQLAFAGTGKGEFVERIVSEFERRHVGVDEDALSWIVNQALVPDQQWDEALKAGNLDLPATAEILWEMLEEAESVMKAAGEYTIREPHAKQAFDVVVRRRRRCPFPFWC